MTSVPYLIYSLQAGSELLRPRHEARLMRTDLPTDTAAALWYSGGVTFYQQGVNEALGILIQTTTTAYLKLPFYRSEITQLLPMKSFLVSPAQM